jgi:2-oxoglutarate dehydrogenase E1 component
VARLAFEYRQQFHKDVVIDMLCYRRLGHNEGDDPSYTQPLMYKRINARRSVRKLYTEALVNRGDISVEEAEQALEDFQSRLQEALEQTRSVAAPKDIIAAVPPTPVGVLPRIETGVDRATLDRIYDVMSSPPPGFTVHPKLLRQFDTRTKVFREEGEVDWALGEAFAFGSLLLEGIDIRIAGQDSRRGTFSHRHAVLVDNVNEADWCPLANLDPGQGKLWIYDSLLSEYAALGFEWGYATTNPAALVAWEAQFGDFVNGAQIVIDQYLVAAEDKWGIANGVVMLLPHGYEGQGPEHSSARIERFLSACAEDNIQVVNPTTAGQYFHLMRRQMLRTVRKPLVIPSPKSLLRAKTARSKVEELTSGSFREVLADPTFAGDAAAVQRVVLASGKVSHEAITARDAAGAPVVVLRVEQLYPWPYDFLAEALAEYPNARELVWLQEEPENMGPWNFVKGKLYEALGDRFTIKRVSRFESGSPATGSKAVHDQEQAMILSEALDLNAG